MAKEKKINLPISADLLERLAKFQEIELQDVEIELDEIEFDLGSGGSSINPAIINRMAFEFALIRDSANRMTQLLGGSAIPTTRPSGSTCVPCIPTPTIVTCTTTGNS